MTRKNHPRSQPRSESRCSGDPWTSLSAMSTRALAPIILPPRRRQLCVVSPLRNSLEFGFVLRRISSMRLDVSSLIDPTLVPLVEESRSFYSRRCAGHGPTGRSELVAVREAMPVPAECEPPPSLETVSAGARHRGGERGLSIGPGKHVAGSARRLRDRSTVACRERRSSDRHETIGYERTLRWLHAGGHDTDSAP